jgi:hypothetical protein
MWDEGDTAEYRELSAAVLSSREPAEPILDGAGRLVIKADGSLERAVELLHAELQYRAQEEPEPCLGPLATLSGASQRLLLHCTEQTVEAALEAARASAKAGRAELLSGPESDAVRNLRQVEALALRTATEHRSRPEGSACAVEAFEVWRQHWGASSLVATAELVAASPANGSAPIANCGRLRRRIALMERGAVPIVALAQQARECGAVGLVIGDSASDACRSGFTQRCMPGSSKELGTGMARTDPESAWIGVSGMPVSLMRRRDWLHVLSHLPVH